MDSHDPYLENTRENPDCTFLDPHAAYPYSEAVFLEHFQSDEVLSDWATDLWSKHLPGINCCRTHLKPEMLAILK